MLLQHCPQPAAQSDYRLEKRDSIKRLSFRYCLRADYSSPVRRHSFAFSFLPRDTARQRVTALDIAIPGCPGFRETAGAFGCRRVYGAIEKPHSDFVISLSGSVTTGLDIFEEAAGDALDAAPFRAQTGLTQPGEQLRRFHRSLSLTGSDYDKAIAIQKALHETLVYLPGATAAHESAEAAFAKGRGVCQDYAHCMAALLRMEGIPARYVTGMMLGEGASHAWVEALCGSWWYGFDPTNDLLADDSYIRVRCGRDSADCSIIRGTFYGPACQMQQETVEVSQDD